MVEGKEFRELMLQVVRTRMAFRRSMQRTLKKNNAGITFEMLQILSCLWHEQGITQQVLAERTKLPEQAVQILVCTFLPGTIWVGKIDLAMQSFFNAAPVGKLRAPVAGNGLDQLRRESGQCSDNGVLHGLRPSVR